MTGKTNTGSDEALKRKHSCTNRVNLVVNVANTTSSKTLSDFNRLKLKYAHSFEEIKRNVVS